MITSGELTRGLIGVAVLLGITYTALRLGQIRLGYAPLIAIVRGGIQLTFVGLALRGVLTAPPTVAAALTVMLGTACWTASRRLKPLGKVFRVVVPRRPLRFPYAAASSTNVSRRRARACGSRKEARNG